MYDTLKNHILHLLQKDGTARTKNLLAQELGITVKHFQAFEDALDMLSREGQVVVDLRDRVKLTSMDAEVTGIFHANARGYGFVSPQSFSGEGELFIPAKFTGNAMTGDRVLAEITRKRLKHDQDRVTGKIVKVLERAHATIVGMLERQDDRWCVHPDGGDFLQPIVLEQVNTREVRHGDKVLVKIRAYPTRSHPARGVIADILGQTGRYDAEIAAIIRRHNLHDEFDDSSLVQANNARETFNPQNLSGREDLTPLLTLTIDPPEAKDFDDAISLTQDREGFWVLGVHIADVSHFIPEGSALDRCARLRGNSVYLPGRTLPMLPEMLSNGICSLQPARVRYTKSVFMTFNKDGEVMHTRFANSAIRSTVRLTYRQADHIIKGGRSDAPPEVVTLLQNMNTLAQCIERRRRRAGMLQLSMPEVDLVLDDSNRVMGVEPKDTCYPHRIIEMFMVEANVAVATLLDRLCIPFMRRIHPEPNAASLRQLAGTLRLLGIPLSRTPHRYDLQALLDRIRNTRGALPVNLLVLRSLAKATYAPMNVGHYALSAPKYCHFTSPIRRYADLLVHRVLNDYIQGNIEKARRRLSVATLNEIGNHISATEQAADEATEEVKNIFILHVLAKRQQEEFPGIIVNLTNYGVFVHLSDYGIQGLIRPEALGADHWHFDEQSQCLIGRHTGVVVRLAQPMRVRIAEIHPAAGHLDLIPARPLLAKQAPKKKSPTPKKKRKTSSSKHRTKKKPKK